MKSWSLKVLTVNGTEVRIHATFLLLILFAGWSGSVEGGSAGALHASLLICLMFLCVLLHEFGHVAAARHYGIKTPDITLLPIGGVARLERMPREPWQEFVVAICGPLVNAVIAALISIVLREPPSLSMSVDFVQGSIWRGLMNWNLVMIAFNMIPAFPMDGGRVLRALLAMVFDYGQATRLAASIGQSIAIFGSLAALFWIHSPMLIVIAFFIFMSAGQEAAMVTEEESSRGLSIGNAMVTDFHTLPPHSTLKDAVELLLAGTQHDFPIVDESGGFVGLLTRNALIAGLAEHGKDHPAASVMETCEILLDPHEPLSAGMSSLRNSSFPALPVINPMTGRLVGLLTGENIGEVMMVRAALQANR